MTQNNERELMEQLAKEQGLKPVAYTDPMNILSYRNSYTVTENKTKLNTVDLWTGDQLEAFAKAYKSPISQNEQQEVAAWRYKFTKNGDWKYLSVYPNGCEDSCPVFVDALYTSPKQIPDGWKPIETAPKDGTRLLLDIDHGDYGDRVWTGLWADGWMVSYGKANNEPTHWMPLPAPTTSLMSETNTEVGE